MGEPQKEESAAATDATLRGLVEAKEAPTQ